MSVCAGISSKSLSSRRSTPHGGFEFRAGFRVSGLVSRDSGLGFKLSGLGLGLESKFRV